VTHIPSGRDGSGHRTAVIDFHDREIVGNEFTLRGRTKETERALEMACWHDLGRFAPPEPHPFCRVITNKSL